MSKKHTRKAKKILLVTIGILSAGLNHLVNLVHLPFFNNIDAVFASSSNTPGGASMINLIFITFRALYFIYFLFSLIGIFNSVTKKEDWTTKIQTPFILLLCISLTDLLTRFVFKLV